MMIKLPTIPITLPTMISVLSTTIKNNNETYMYIYTVQTKSGEYIHVLESGVFEVGLDTEVELDTRAGGVGAGK